MLRINGIYLGIVDLFERSVQLSPDDKIVCEIIPLGNYLPITFLLNDTFLLQPPPQIRLYFTENTVAIYCCDFLCSDQALRVLQQERIHETLLTLTAQGKIQLYLQNERSHLIDLPYDFIDCRMQAYREDFLLIADHAFALISNAGKILLLSEGNVLSSDETIRAEIPFHDSQGHTAVCEWERDKLITCTVRTARQPTAATFALAFFESLKIGADVLPFLSDDLKSKSNDLQDYLGNFNSIVLTDDPTKIGLVFPRKERIFDVRYFTVTLKDEKIDNIQPLS